MTPLASLVGARVRRIDAPSSDLWALTLAAGDLRGTLMFSLAPGASGVGWVARRPHGQPATGFVQKLRRELEGGRVRAFAGEAGLLELTIARGEDERRLRFDFANANVLLFAGDTPIASARKLRADDAGAPPSAIAWPDALEPLEAQGAALLEQRGDALFEAQRAVLAKSIATAKKRLKRRLAAVADDAARADEAPALRARGQLLLANLHASARGAKSVKLVDYTLDPPAEVELALDPVRSPREQAEAWFKQARRFERGASLAQQRTAASEAELAELDALAKAIAACTEASELAPLAERCEVLGVRAQLPSDLAGSEKPRGPQRHTPYRTLRGSGGRTILVGKGAADNDTLTREVARPQDLWLHARDRAGAHVVVPLERGETCPAELLIDAATLAAHFSDARGELDVDVIYTPKRYVRKPKGAAVGLVVLERERVLRVRVEQERLAGLLKTQRD